MLLRRFHFLNYLPIAAIQGQGLAKRTIHVRGFFCLYLLSYTCSSRWQAGVAKEIISRNQILLKDGKYLDQKDLLSRLRELFPR